MSVSESNLEVFTAAYIEALLWSSVVEVNGEYVNADKFELSTAAADTCRADCRAFCSGYAFYLEEATGGIDDYGWSEAGHDFALTRNGHGSGYWDNDLMSAALSDALTEAAKACGEVNLYLDNNEVHLS